MNETPLNQLVLAEEEEERGSQVVVGFCRTLSTMWDNRHMRPLAIGLLAVGPMAVGPMDMGPLDTGPMGNGTFEHRIYEQWTTRVVTM